MGGKRRRPMFSEIPKMQRRDAAEQPNGLKVERLACQGIDFGPERLRRIGRCPECSEASSSG